MRFEIGGQLRTIDEGSKSYEGTQSKQLIK